MLVFFRLIFLKFNLKFLKKIIDLTKHSYRQEHFVYQLHGLIQHIGGGLNFGHYICAMRGFNNRDMFLFDDSEVFLFVVFI